MAATTSRQSLIFNSSAFAFVNAPLARKLAGDLQLLAQVHGGAGALLAVAERRVKDEDSVVIHMMWAGHGSQGTRCAGRQLESKQERGASAECCRMRQMENR
jgi:hypothetical protein